MADMVRLAGIDVSKQTLEVYVMPSGESRTVSNDRCGLGELRRWLVGQGVAIAAVEASGGYERSLLDCLHKAQVAWAMVNPARVRDYARSEGLRAKTDRLDAKVILAFAQSKAVTAMQMR